MARLRVGIFCYLPQQPASSRLTHHLLSAWTKSLVACRQEAQAGLEIFEVCSLVHFAEGFVCTQPSLLACTEWCNCKPVVAHMLSSHSVRHEAVTHQANTADSNNGL